MKQLTMFLSGIAFLFAASVAHAQSNPSQNQPQCTESCNQSTQNMGDTSTSAGDSHNVTQQTNPSSNSNQSGNDITTEQKLQQSGNTVDQSGSSQQSSATGGNAYGNLSTNSNDNRSSVGNTSSNSGGNTLGNTMAGNSNNGGNGGNVDSNATTTSGSATTTSGNVTTQGGAGGAGGKVSNSGNSSIDGNVLKGGSVGNTSAESVSDSGHNTLQTGSSASTRDSGNSSQGQNQSQKQGISESGNSKNSNKTRSSADNSGGNSAVNIDASDRSSHNYSEKTTFIPSVVPVTPPTGLPSSNISTVVTACHGLTQVTHEKVTGKYIGFFKTKNIDLGTTDTLEPYIVNGEQQFYYTQKESNGSVKLWGIQSIIQSAVVGVAGGRNIALGGGSGSGNWGQGGFGSTSAMQQIVTHIIQVPCEIGTLQPAPVVMISKKIKE